MADDQETRVGNPVVSEDAAAPVGEGEPAQQTEVFFSRDEAQGAQAAPTPPPPSDEPASGGSSPAAADRIAADQHDAFAEKPHLYALGAFAGAFVVAQVLKRITGGDD
jgi:hypothetical protein